MKVMSGSRRSVTTAPGPGVSPSSSAGGEPLRRGVDGDVDAAAAAVAEPVPAAKEAVPGQQQDKHDDDHGEDSDHASGRPVASLAAQSRRFQMAHLLAITIGRWAPVELVPELRTSGARPPPSEIGAWGWRRARS